MRCDDFEAANVDHLLVGDVANVPVNSGRKALALATRIEGTLHGSEPCLPRGTNLRADSRPARQPA
jgi:hypothetical protein